VKKERRGPCSRNGGKEGGRGEVTGGKKLPALRGKRKSFCRSKFCKEEEKKRKETLRKRKEGRAFVPVGLCRKGKKKRKFCLSGREGRKKARGGGGKADMVIFIR